MKTFLKQISSPKTAWIILAMLIIDVGAGLLMSLSPNLHFPVASKTKSVPQGKYGAFALEIYDTIAQNYWDKITDAQLSQLYLLAANKVTGQTFTLSSPDKQGVKKLIDELASQKPEKDNQQLLPQINDVVLQNLQPFGRSSLYTQKSETTLNNEVNNVDPSANLYATLGLVKAVSIEQINQAYLQKVQELSKQNTPEAKKELAQVDRAHEALSTPERKARYDQSGAEPTTLEKLINPQTLYVDLTRFSPTTLQEMKESLDKYASSTSVQALVIDLRGNIGGDIDLIPYFSGAFLGQGQYAYQLYHQGSPEPIQTTLTALPELEKYKKIVVLTDGQTQSSAELLASVLKKYHIAVLVGAKTKGWGTIERVFPLTNQIDDSQKYSVFLVHTLTLRDDNLPVEGNGVVPNVNTSDKNWQQELLDYYNFPPLVDAIKQII